MSKIFPNRKLLSIFAIMLIAVSLLAPGLSSAQETEEDYPMGGPTTTEAAPESVVVYIYRISMLLVGMVGFGSFLYGGFKYMTSAGNPAARRSAEKRMKASFGGMALLLSIYLILRTINPDLLYPSIEPPKPSRGVCLYKDSAGEEERKCFTESLKEIPIDFNPSSIEFLSSQKQLKGAYLFNKKEWKGTSKWHKNTNPSFEDSSALKSISISPVKSFFLMWKKAGIYLHKKEKCEADFPGQPYQIYNSNIADLKDYRNQVSSVSFKNKVGQGTESEPEAGYIATFHEEVNYEGRCGIAFGNDPSHPTEVDVKCSPRGINNLDSAFGGKYIQGMSNPLGSSVKSMQAFAYDFEGNATGTITFYEKANFEGDNFEIGAGDLNNHGFWRWRERNNIEYPFSADQQGEKADDDGEMDRILSAKIEGKLLLIMTKDQGLDGYCQVYESSDADLSDDYVIREPWNAKISTIFIIPIND